MKSKIHRTPWPGPPAPTPRATAHTAFNREYLRALRAAEMAAWEAADRKAGSLHPLTALQSPAVDVAQEVSRPHVADGLVYPACVLGAAIGLLAGVGILSRITDDVLQFAGLVQQIVS